MDAEQFDQLARRVVRCSTRRTLLGALLAAFPGTLGLPAEIAVKGKRRKKGKKGKKGKKRQAGGIVNYATECEAEHNRQGNQAEALCVGFLDCDQGRGGDRNAGPRACKHCGTTVQPCGASARISPR